MTSILKHNVPYHILVVGAVLLGVVISFDYCKVSGAVPPRNRVLDSKQNDLSPITLDEYLEGRFGAHGFAGSWVEGSDHLIRIFTPEDIVDYDIINGGNSTVITIKDITDQLKSPFSNIIFSHDKKFALIEHGRSSLWRYSTLAKYDIFDLNTKVLTDKVVPPPPSEGENDEQKALQLVKWSPTGNGIAFVADYNIYYRPNAEPNTVARQITKDGSEEQAIYNGVADWVYEEEMFGGPTALWISPSASNLAFVRFDDSKVENFQYPIYGEPRSNATIYPEYRSIRYPKAGFPNPEAKVFIVSLTNENSSPVQLSFPETTEEDQHLIGTALWVTDTELMVATLNRVQTTSQWHLCSAATAECKKIHTYSLDHGWVDMNTPKVSKDGSKLIFYKSVKQESTDESFYHIVMFKSDGTSDVITSGRLSVTDILGWDEDKHKIFFSGSRWSENQVDPSETQIYWVSDNEPNAKPNCITCELKSSGDKLCRENGAIFSSNFTYFIHKCSGPDVPETTTRQTEDGAAIANPGPTYVDNAKLRADLEKKLVPITREYTVNVTDRFIARARLYIPADYDETKKYPLLISVYGGPGSQNVKQGFGIQWETSLVSDKKIIFGLIDGRGTSKQSTEHLFELHNKLGTAEIEDQITVAKWLIENEPLIDPERTSIWGWSYGGYATAKVLETDTENVFKCGISVAPVTSWRYYDTIYTERYMGLPTEEDNLKGYNDSDVISKEHVENLRNKQYMLVHGNADDNVHYQQSMILARSLEQNDIFFHQLSYPDENHGIGGPGMRRHLYHSLQRFLFDECYKIPNQNDDRRGSGGSGDSGASTIINYSLSVVLSSIIVIVFGYFN